MQDNNNATISGTAIRATVRDMDSNTLNWSLDNLGSYLPTPDHQASQTPMPNHDNATTPSRTEEIALQLSAAAHQLIQSAVEQSNTSRTMPKEIPENLQCFLLSISGLTWDEWHLLAPIWSELY